tara:strand:+ start:1563 stop:1688 length:126 start_codon:yes stop_codon:yes gene_type:complete
VKKNIEITGIPGKKYLICKNTDSFAKDAGPNPGLFAAPALT